jgi:hypothetical protein
MRSGRTIYPFSLRLGPPCVLSIDGDSSTATNRAHQGRRRAMAKEIFCGFGVDVDAVAGWLGSYGGEDSPDDISRGLLPGK